VITTASGEGSGRAGRCPTSRAGARCAGAGSVRGIRGGPSSSASRRAFLDSDCGGVFEKIVCPRGVWTRLQCTRFTAVGYPCGPVRARLEARFSMNEVEPAEEKPRAEGPDPSPVPTPWNLGLAHDQSSWRGARTGRSSRGSRREVALRGQWRRSGPVADSRCGSRRGRVRRYRSLATRPLHRRRLRSPRHLPQPTRRPALRHHGAGAGRCRGADGTTVLDGPSSTSRHSTACCARSSTSAFCSCPSPPPLAFRRRPRLTCRARSTTSETTRRSTP
jgi:hypothetical protein